MIYALVKILHVNCVVISYALFVTRGVWMINDSPMLQRRWARILPHVNDSILLAAAITLAVMLRQYPLTHGWLTAKAIGLVAYIGLGTLAFKPGRTRRARIAAWVAAQVVFFYIVGVALTKKPLLFF